MEKEVKGQLVAYTQEEKSNKKNVKYTAHIFTFKVGNGLTDVEMGNEDYIEGFLKSVGYDDLEEYADDMIESGDEITLYLVNTDDFFGYNMSRPFPENHKVDDLGKDVLVTDVIATESGITLTLEDGTIGKRSFSKSIKDKNGEELWFPDVQKKGRFIKNEVGEDPMTYDLNNLKGRYVTYVWDSVGNNSKNEFLKIKSVADKPKSKTDNTEDLLSQLSGD